jgi:shikimate dehydrogenase
MAVTMPYKKKIIKFLDKLDNFSKKTSSVNLVVKRKNKLFGYNTDIYGARECFKNKIKKYQNIIIFGLGGTGQAIFNYLHHTYKSKNFYLISNKYHFKSNNVKILKKINKKILNDKALIFNCTPLGSNLKKSFKKKLPMKNELIHEISNESFMFDIIYSPIQTILLKECKLHGLEGINGLRMNTLQAEKALNIVFNKSK